MALNGSFSTNAYDGRYYTISWSASQDVAKNCSTISWTLSTTGGKSWYAERTLVVAGAGSTLYSKTDRVERYAGNITSGTFYINHKSDGSGQFSMAISAAVYGSAVNCTGSATFTLNNIPRKSELSVGNGTLDSSLNMTVTRKSSNFTHTVTAEVANVTSWNTTICTKSSSTSLSYTPPLWWCQANKSGTSISVRYKIITYSGNTEIGSNSYVKSLTIPKVSGTTPTVSLNISDATSYSSIYGKYVQGYSKIKVSITGTGAYESSITKYSSNANGSWSGSSSYTTGVVTGTGTKEVNAAVVDSRGFASPTVKKTYDILAYSKPTVSKIGVSRCNQDGTPNDQGEYAKVTFSAAVTNLNSKNTAKYSFWYKKTKDSEWSSEIELTDYSNQWSVTDGTYIFPADSGYTYNVCIRAKDNLNQFDKYATVSTATTIMHWLKSGLGMAIGKIAEIENAFEVGWKSLFRQGLYTGQKESDYDNKNGVSVGQESIVVQDTGGYPRIGFAGSGTKRNAVVEWDQPINSLVYHLDDPSGWHNFNANMIGSKCAKFMGGVETDRPTSCNRATTGSGGIYTFHATSSMTTGKPMDDAHILGFEWDTTGGWDNQLALINSSNNLQTRAMNNGTWGSWKTYGQKVEFYTDSTGGYYTRLLRFPDVGIQIEWKCAMYNRKINTAWGSGFESSRIDLTSWKWSFNDLQAASCYTMSKNATDVWLASYGAITTTSAGSYYLQRNTKLDESRDYWVYAWAIGTY